MCTRIMPPRLRAIPKVSFIGIAEVRISPAALSFSCGRKGWGAMHDEPVLMQRFPCPAPCQNTPNFELYANGGGTGGVPSCAHVHQAVNFLFFCHLHADAVNRVRGLRQLPRFDHIGASGERQEAVVSR